MSDVQIVSAIILMLGLPVLATMRPEKIVFYTLPFVLLSRHMPFLYTVANGVILIVVLLASIKTLLARNDGVDRLRLLFHNPFLYFSIILFFVYFVSYLYSDFNTGLPGEKNQEYLISLFCVLVYGNFIISFVHNEERFLGLVKSLFIVLLINLAFAPLSLMVGQVDYLGGFVRSQTIEAGSGLDKASRLGGLFFFWEEYSQYLAMTLLGIGAAIFAFKGKYRWVLICVFLIGMVELLLTNSRGSILVFGFGFVLLFLFSRGLGKSSIKAIMTFGLLALFTGGAIYIAELTGYLHLQERFSLMSQMVSTKYGDLPVARAGVWVPALDSAREKLTIGHGPSYYPLTSYSGFDGKLLWPHNLWLLILNTTGILGLTVYIFICGWAVKISFSTKRLAISPLTKTIIFGIGLGWLAFFMESFKFGGWLRFPSGWFYYLWILMALTFSISNFKRIRYRNTGIIR